MSSVILFLVPRIQFKARTARYRNAKYDKNGTSKFCTIKWAKETDINFEHQKKLKIYEERSGVKNSFEIKTSMVWANVRGIMIICHFSLSWDPIGPYPRNPMGVPLVYGMYKHAG